jgi:hypothetical protein
LKRDAIGIHVDDARVRVEPAPAPFGFAGPVVDGGDGFLSSAGE